MEKLNWREEIQTKGFCISLLLYLITACLDYTQYIYMEPYVIASDIVKAVAMAILLACSIINIKFYNWKQLAAFVFIGVMAFFSYRNYQSMAVFVLLAFWANMRNVDFDIVYNAYFISILVATVFTILSCLVGIIPDWIHEDGGHAVGFSHSNNIGLASMAIEISWFGLRRNKTKWYEYALFIVLAIFFGVYTRSTGSAIVAILIVIASIISNQRLSPLLEKIMTIIVCSVYPVLEIANLVYLKFADSESRLFQMVNSALNGRLSLGKDGVIKYGLSLFGQSIDWFNNGEYHYLDSAYIRIPVSYGIVVALILVLVFTFLSIKVCKRKQWYEAGILVALAIHAIIENTFVYLAFNPMTIAAGIIFYDDSNIKCSFKEAMDFSKEKIQKIIVMHKDE